MKIRKRYNGYFTVEAALIMPLVMIIIVVMMFLAIYCYDRCVMEQCAYEAAVRGSSNRYRENKLACQEAGEAARTLIEGKLFAIKEWNYEVTADANEITVTYTAEFNMPFISWITEEYGNHSFDITVEKKAWRNRQINLVRAFRKINRLFGVGEVPEDIEEE